MIGILNLMMKWLKLIWSLQFLIFFSEQFFFHEKQMSLLHNNTVHFPLMLPMF